MTKVHHRAAALALAALFLFTTFGTSALVIWQISQQRKTDPTKELTNQINNQIKQGDKLEGTKLADFTPVASVSDLVITDIKEGDGEVVAPGATVTAHYTGALAADGTIFQSSHDQPGDQPVEFPLDGVIQGWVEGVPGMKVGGVRRLLIPTAKAYGSNPPAANIPANADLVFDVELVAVKNQ